ncbi:MAG: ketopantoate reductase family protein [Candidatus Eisenbacteria bacterium]|uniref:2-dehydropantoate 2-reductase n=1 Tax=Eiseniibacteriota bacterium TaxID=2212470 RepID=A0A938BNQ2_UNCEI|nr:ketopantoate reductase family protein [Candidatus Eisenbacteria bacterium]
MGPEAHFWVIGAGAVGSTLAAMLEGGAPGHVTLVGGSAHWRAVRERGLVVETGDAGAGGSSPVSLQTASPAEVPRLGSDDLALLTGKLTRLEETALWLRERLGPSAGAVALQNGLRVDERVGERLGRSIDRGLVYFGARVPEPGRLLYYPGRLRLRDAPATRILAERLGREGPECELLADLRAAEWEKLSINCLANPLAALLGGCNADLADPGLDRLKAPLLAEVRAVAAAEGVELEMTPGDFNRYIGGATGGNIPSMAVDIARGEPTEIEYLNGEIVRLGRERGIPTPVNATVADLVRALERRAVGRSGPAPETTGAGKRERRREHGEEARSIVREPGAGAARPSGG